MKILNADQIVVFPGLSCGAEGYHRFLAGDCNVALPVTREKTLQ